MSVGLSPLLLFFIQSVVPRHTTHALHVLQNVEKVSCCSHRLGKASPAINGLAAAALGICALQHSSSELASIPRAGPIQEILVSRIGAAKLLGLLDALQQDKYYLAAKALPCSTSRPQDRGGTASGAGAKHGHHASGWHQNEHAMAQPVKYFLLHARLDICTAKRDLSPIADVGFSIDFPLI